MALLGLPFDARGTHEFVVQSSGHCCIHTPHVKFGYARKARASQGGEGGEEGRIDGFGDEKDSQSGIDSFLVFLPGAD